MILRFAATRAGSWLFSRLLERVDKFVLRLTSGQHTLTTLLTGLPVIRLTTYGAVTGRPRVCPLVPLPDGESLVVFGTNFGAKQHPSWYRNLMANPEVIVSYNGASGGYVARPVEDADRVRYWREILAIYPGFGDYASRAGGRKIPIIRLSPRAENPRHP